MDNKKSPISIFSNRRNPLDNVIGKVPIKSLLLGFASIFAVVILLIAGASQIEYPCIARGDLFIEGQSINLAQGRLKAYERIMPRSEDIFLEMNGDSFKLRKFSNEIAGSDGGYFYDITIEASMDKLKNIRMREQMPVRISIANCKQNFLFSLLRSYF
ncbi:MAG: hypothetical protein U0U09_18680 [Cyclobacteriaceae bacterium]